MMMMMIMNDNNYKFLFPVVWQKAIWKSKVKRYHNLLNLMMHRTLKTEFLMLMHDVQMCTNTSCEEIIIYNCVFCILNIEEYIKKELF